MSSRTHDFPHLLHKVDLCVIGGGMTGLCAALAAARHGAQVLLVHDRPVLGGNASSECRVPISGADRSGSIPFMRETGILEEFRLENIYQNPHREYSLWDLVLYDKVQYQPNLTLLLNCTCQEAKLASDSIESITGWQLTTQTYHTVKARLFADCSGDGILAPLTKHPFRMGREARHEYDESIAPEVADDRTMGMTCFFGAREYDTPQPYTPPAWAYRFDSPEELPYGMSDLHWFRQGYWWIELGGEAHAIHDTETLRGELLRITLGVWDHIKNRGDYGADNWALEWIQFLPAKRESRRYLGAYVLTQRDLEAEGRFDDTVAYGGWTMDDHHPSGFYSAQRGVPATIFHQAPSPYGIPYRSLYSTYISNLLFAGRCHSTTHAALSSTRVMGTCCTMGQAVGAAAALAIAKGIMPAGMLEHMHELQQTLLADDCYLPWVIQEMPAVTREAQLTASHGHPEPVRDGMNRPVAGDMHSWPCRVGDWIAYQFDTPRHVDHMTLILDSALEKDLTFTHYYPTEASKGLPGVLPKTIRVEGLSNGAWSTIYHLHDNHQRFVRLPLDRTVHGVRVTIEELWQGEASQIYGFYLT